MLGARGLLPLTLLLATSACGRLGYETAGHLDAGSEPPRDADVLDATGVGTDASRSDAGDADGGLGPTEPAAGSPCTDYPDALLCTNFDSILPSGWRLTQSGGTLELSSTGLAHSPPASLAMTVSRSDDYVVATANFARSVWMGETWMRAYVRVRAGLIGSAASLASLVPGGAFFGEHSIELMLREDGALGLRSSYLDTTFPDSFTAVANDAWHCVEIGVFADPSDGWLRLYVNGREAFFVDGLDTHPESSFTGVALGPTHLAPGSATLTVLYDDVAAREGLRIPCAIVDE